MYCSSNLEKCRVALLSGGRSGERDVSLASGACVKRALESKGFSVVSLDPSSRKDLARLLEEDFDVAFLCMHGKFGEDGTIQGFLELLDIPYTGSGVWSSSSAIDKVKTKRIYESARIKTPFYVAVKKGDSIDVASIAKMVGSKVVVKASSEGSTLGLYIAETESDIEEAIEKAFRYDESLLIEEYISGREFTVAVLGNENAEALPAIEIVPKNAFYDFDAKYSPGGSLHICPASIEDGLASRLRCMAELAHRALDCKGASRTDFLIDDDGECWALETNTLPGMTDTSLLPDAARAIGMTYEDLCTKLLSLAFE